MGRVFVVVAIALLAGLWLVTSSQGGNGSNSERIAIRCGDKTLVRPRRCVTLGITGGASELVALVDLRWSNWGRRSARAHGYLFDPERGTRTAAVKVLVYGQTSCDDGVFYRVLRLGHRGHTVARLLMQPCAG